ncbi:MAG: methyltransferase domain-containing protein [Abyssibacter sp.]|nr:class I SAM-dependent methyltransferase [Abyssibacter sp.]MCK5858778.1 methyltransferase domain-containing protein [Abyssibacter sp.]
MVEPVGLPHAVLDLTSRQRKAVKIELLLGLANREQPIRLLEIGTGAGGIAHYFAQHPTLVCRVTAGDVTDQRIVRDGYHFERLSGSTLPFDDRTFDVVISNHVIEHVGNRAAQLVHLRSIRRVLDVGGEAYLAVPNRWMVVEPHFRLPFLSWLPPALRSPYVRLLRRGDRYDCTPPSARALDALVREAGLCAEALEHRAVHALIAADPNAGWPVRLAGRLPAWCVRAARPLIPTLIVRLTASE